MADLGAIASAGSATAAASVSVVVAPISLPALKLCLTTGVSQVTEPGISSGIPVPSFPSTAGAMTGALTPVELIGVLSSQPTLTGVLQ